MVSLKKKGIKATQSVLHMLLNFTNLCAFPPGAVQQHCWKLEYCMDLVLTTTETSATCCSLLLLEVFFSRVSLLWVCSTKIANLLPAAMHGEEVGVKLS